MREITINEIIEILGTTIKRDNLNKITTFLSMLLAYTEDSQINISFQAPSSTGKSFIAMEIAKYFPEEDIIELAGCTPNAMLYDGSNYNKEQDFYLVNLERKIIIFLEQPGTDLLSKIRPLLSHDKKELRFESTDPNKMKKRTAIMRGFCSVIFCTAGLRIDEQESTRFLLLSPDMDQEKLREAIIASVKIESNKDKVKNEVESNPQRKELKERIRMIKERNIKNIIIPDEDKIIERYFQTISVIKPRHQRDNKRLLGLIKAHAILNCFNREKDGDSIIANEKDIDTAFELWGKLSKSQELNISPFLCDFMERIIIPEYKRTVRENKDKDFGLEVLGVSRKDIQQKYYKENGKSINEYYLRTQIIPVLVSAGVIREEASVIDKRNRLVIPILEEYQIDEEGDFDDPNEIPF